MAWLILLLILAIGLSLIVIEIIFVPGTTVVGIVGFLCLIGGVMYGFSMFGNLIGWWVTGGTSLLLVISIAVSLKSGTWNRFALKQTIESKVNDQVLLNIVVGSEGVALSALKPIGNAEFGNTKVEVTSLGEFIDSNENVRVVNIESKKIIVEQLNK